MRTVIATPSARDSVAGLPLIGHAIGRIAERVERPA
jgi:hypothetical protein